MLTTLTKHVCCHSFKNKLCKGIDNHCVGMCALQDADGSFRMPADGDAGNEALDAVMQFVQAVAADSLEECTLPPPRPEQV